MLRDVPVHPEAAPQHLASHDPAGAALRGFQGVARVLHIFAEVAFLQVFADDLAQLEPPGAEETEDVVDALRATINDSPAGFL